MTTSLRLVSPEEQAIADAIGTWLATYSSESGRRSMESSLRSVMRAYLEVGVDENVQIAMFPWDALADWQYFKSVAIKIEKHYGKKRGAKHIIALRSLVRSLAQCGLADFSHVSETLARNKVKASLDTAPSIEFSTGPLAHTPPMPPGLQHGQRSSGPRPHLTWAQYWSPTCGTSTGQAR